MEPVSNKASEQFYHIYLIEIGKGKGEGSPTVNETVKPVTLRALYFANFASLTRSIK